MRKAFNIAANVTAIIIFGLFAVGATYALFTSLNGIYWYAGLILLALCIAGIIVAAIALAKGNENKVLGLRVTMIVLLGILALLLILGGTNGVVFGLFTLVPLELEITALCVKEKTAQSETTEQKTPTIEDKIAELKHLFDLKVINEEQYNNAITALIEELKK